VAGTYNVEASYGDAKKTSSFSLASPITASLAPLNSIQNNEISATMAGSDITVSWNAVSGAKSYYVNLWAEVWNVTTSQFDYKEVWRSWVATTSVTIAKIDSNIPENLTCDVYVTAHELNMTTTSPPAPLPTRADMSENYYSYILPFLTP